ncbi:MAG: Cys-tRNA(Pro) deacylase [Glaciihabitans sp.]
MAKKGDVAGATPATVALIAAGVAFVPHSYSHDPSTRAFGQEAATALDLDPDRVFKTLLVDVDGTLAVAVVPVSGSLDLGALAAVLGGKRATMADPALAQRKTGYVLGGISPIGQKTRLSTVVDETAQLYNTVFVSGGRRGFDIELSPTDLIAVTAARVGAIARD